MCTQAEARREAKSRGLRWAAVCAAYEEIKVGEWARRERPNEIRSTAWAMANAHAPGKWDFWRHGFASQYGARVDRHDYTVIPRYDVLAQEIGSHFPEYATDNGTERLWDFLLSPYDRYPTAAELWRRALDLAERVARHEEGSGEKGPEEKKQRQAVPF